MNLKKVQDTSRELSERTGDLPDDPVLPAGEVLADGQHRVTEMVLDSVEDDDPDLLCTWQTGGSYESPPEYCDLEKERDEEYCPIHKERAEALDKLNP